MMDHLKETPKTEVGDLVVKIRTLLELASDDSRIRADAVMAAAIVEFCGHHNAFQPVVERLRDLADIIERDTWGKRGWTPESMARWMQ